MSVRFARFSAEKIVYKTPEQGLCISSFLLIQKKGALLLGKAIQPDFAKDKWVLPASQLKYGEHPDDAAKRIIKEQLNTEAKSVSYRGLWSFANHHWDLCFIYDVKLRTEPRPLKGEEAAKYPPEYFNSSQLLGELRYFKPKEIRPDMMGRGQEDVLRAVGLLPA